MATNDNTISSVGLGDGWEAHIYRQWSFPEHVLEAWHRLACEYGDAGIFIGPSWFETWWEAFGTDKALRVVVLEKYKCVEAIFPCHVALMGNGEKQRSQFRSLTNDHTCFYDFLIGADSRSEAMGKFLAMLPKLAHGQNCIVESLPSFSPNIPLLLGLMRERRIPAHSIQEACAPWLSVSGNWDEFLAGIPRKLRNTIKRCRKKAEEIGTVNFINIEQGPQISSELEALFELEAMSWKGEEGTAIKVDRQVVQFYRRLADWAIRDRRLLIFLHNLNGRMISASLCLRSGATVFGLKLAHDISLGKLSPGTLLQGDILKHLFSQSDIAVYNFLGSCDEWKMRWGASSGQNHSVTIYPASPIGWTRYVFDHGWKIPFKRLLGLQSRKAIKGSHSVDAGEE